MSGSVAAAVRVARNISTVAVALERFPEYRVSTERILAEARYYEAVAAAFITLPIASSSLAMKAAKSACCAHSVP